AHDSICACSHDQVAAAVLHRYAEAGTIAEVLRRRALAAAAALLPPGPVVLNPSAHSGGGAVEVVVEGDAPIRGSQLVELQPAATGELSGTGADLGHLLSRLAADGFRPQEDVVLAEDAAGALTLRFTTTWDHRSAGLTGASVLAEAEARTAARPDQPLRIVAHRPAWQRVAVRADGVLSYGWSRWQPGESEVPPVKTIWEKAPPHPPTAPRAVTIDNGALTVTVDPGDATWTLAPRGRAPVSGLGRLVDGGDAGDTYNYSPPAHDRAVDRPESVTIEVVEPGPVRAVVRVTARYRWPQRLEGDARVGEVPVDVVTALELRAGEEVLRVTTSFDNRSRDHRLRAWFPLPAAAEVSRAECAFAVVERGLTAEGGPHEFGLPTFPSRRFVSAGGLTVLHEGLLEYQLEDGGRALALTLLRATGILSQAVMAYRNNSAGPQMPLEGPQMSGPVAMRYAVHYGDSDPYRLSDQVWVPLEVVYGSAYAAPERGSLLQVEGGEVSALQRVDGQLELRVFNPSAEPATVSVVGRSGTLVDLRGTRQERFDGSFGLRPWAIATARLDP
ncbi:MAG: glycoside hydrolase family 38 C-terminal domain-containing protein, partial [Acidimicrobiales bacterium]